jgi:hypothetical protein
MSEQSNKKSDYDWLEQHDKHMKNWRAWGSWFSWGSPVGLGIFYALVAVSTGVTIWLVHHK